jgi:VWFA-related protein
MIRRLAGVATMIVAVVLPLVAQQPTFSTRRETVRVDVLVSDRGQPVLNLRADEFEILDSGVPQEVEFAAFEEVPLTVTLALDTSVSIDAERLAHLRDGGHAVLENLTPVDRASLLTFADRVVLREPSTPTLDRIKTSLDRLRPTQETFGGTALVDACFTAVTALDEDAARGLLIVFTDGVDTSSWLTAPQVLDVAKRSNLVVYGVSSTPLPKGSFLRDLTDATGGDAIQIRSSALLRPTFVRILDEFRHRYLLSFSPSNGSSTGWHPITVRVKNRRVDVRARPGYTR